MSAPTTFSAFVCTLRDSNNKLLTGKTVQIIETDAREIRYTLIESAARPGSYSHENVQCGLNYDVYIDGTRNETWQKIPFGSGVGRDSIFLSEHDAQGQHTAIKVTSIEFY